MHLKEWWSSIEGYVLEKDWNGVLVCADAIQELGEERLAVTLRWICRKHSPVSGLKITTPEPPLLVWWAFTIGLLKGGPYLSLKNVVTALTDDREEALGFYT